MTDHLPDCDDYAFSGAGFHPNCERICICRQVLRIEQRVRGEERIRAAGIVMDTRKAWRDPDMAWTLIERIKAK